MQARLDPEYLDEMNKRGEKLPDFLQIMAHNKVLFNKEEMLKALDHKATDHVEVSKVRPGDVIMIEGKRHKIKRISDRGEWVTEIIE